MRKRRRISRFSLAGGRLVTRAQKRGHEPGCEVELTEIRTSGQDWWSLAFEATGPVGLLRSQLQATAAHVFAQALPGGMQPSPEVMRRLWYRATGPAPMTRSSSPTEACPAPGCSA